MDVLWSGQSLMQGCVFDARERERSVELPADKNLLRQHFRMLRAKLSEGERRAADAAIAGSMAALPEFAEADGVFTYLSFGAEVDTRELIERAWSLGKTVALPRVVPGTRQMRWYAVDSLDCLERSSFGVEEPPADPAREVTPRDFHTPVALVPGLAFDREGYRLGYGGGYYDRFLSAARACGGPGTFAAVGLAHGCQVLDAAVLASVEGPWDEPVDALALDGSIMRCAHTPSTEERL